MGVVWLHNVPLNITLSKLQEKVITVQFRKKSSCNICPSINYNFVQNIIYSGAVLNNCEV